MIHIVESYLGHEKLLVLQGPEVDLEKLLREWIIKRIGPYPESSVDSHFDREIWYSRRRSLKLADFIGQLDDKWSEQDYIVVESQIK